MGKTKISSINNILEVFEELDKIEVEEKDEELGSPIEKTELQCIDEENNHYKYYRITLYTLGYIAHYGRIGKNPQTIQKKFSSKSEAYTQYRNKVNEKLFPSGSKSRYEKLSCEKVKDVKKEGIGKIVNSFGEEVN